MNGKIGIAGLKPDNTAVRTALWRALHVEKDAAPNVFEDVIGLELAAPPAGWRNRGDMHLLRTARARASIVGRARFIEDIVTTKVREGIRQYVILGAGLDSFAQRNSDIASVTHVFEVDEPEQQAWKRQRLEALEWDIPDWFRLVPVNFESEESWTQALVNAGFRFDKPAIVASSGVSMYLSRETNKKMLRQVAGMAQGTILALTFVLPRSLVEPADRMGYAAAEKGAQQSGTPWLSHFSSQEISALARDAGLIGLQCVNSLDLTQMYFCDRTDGLVPASTEAILIAAVP